MLSLEPCSSRDTTSVIATGRGIRNLLGETSSRQRSRRTHFFLLPPSDRKVSWVSPCRSDCNYQRCNPDDPRDRAGSRATATLASTKRILARVHRYCPLCRRHLPMMLVGRASACRPVRVEYTRDYSHGNKRAPA